MRFGPPTSYSVLHHHLMYMLHGQPSLAATELRQFNELMSVAGIVDFLRPRGFA